MPDDTGATLADSDPAAATSLHAYKDGRTDDVVGDPTAGDIVEEPADGWEDPLKHTPDDAPTA